MQNSGVTITREQARFLYHYGTGYYNGRWNPQFPVPSCKASRVWDLESSADRPFSAFPLSQWVMDHNGRPGLAFPIMPKEYLRDYFKSRVYKAVAKEVCESCPWRRSTLLKPVTQITVDLLQKSGKEWKPESHQIQLDGESTLLSEFDLSVYSRGVTPCEPLLGNLEIQHKVRDAETARSRKERVFKGTVLIAAVMPAFAFPPLFPSHIFNTPIPDESYTPLLKGVQPLFGEV